MVPCYYCTLLLWYHVTIAPCYYGTMVRWYLGAMFYARDRFTRKTKHSNMQRGVLEVKTSEGVFSKGGEGVEALTIELCFRRRSIFRRFDVQARSAEIC